MQQIQSRLLRKLDAEIAKAASPWPRMGLQVQQAIQLLRHGQINLARTKLTELHQAAFHHPNAAMEAWLLLAEGLVLYFTDFSQTARESIEQARVAAESAGLRDIAALSHAWLAHLADARHDIDSLTRHARAGLDMAKPEHHAARTRLAMTVGVAHHYAGNDAQAQVWYRVARQHASQEGDDASLSALMFNTSQILAVQARNRVLAHGMDAAPELLLGADSVKHYDSALGGSAMAEMTPLLRAQILTLQGDFEAALALYVQYLPQAASLGLASLRSSYLADQAWCCINTSRREQSLRLAAQAARELVATTDIDYRAATHSRLAQVFACLGDMAATQRHAADAEQAWRAYALEQQRWALALAAAGLEKP